MDLFTLDPLTFLPQDTIDVFDSVIWTERYTKSGDVTLVVNAAQDMITKLKEGTFLGRAGTKEVMLLETANIEGGKLKVTGNSLAQFLNNRVIRASAAHADRYWNLSNIPAGQLLAAIVNQMCMAGGYMAGNPSIGVDGPREVIPNLSLGAYDTSGDLVSVAVPYGPIYDVLEQQADTFQVGFSLYLDSASNTGYSLKFTTYRGRDLTSQATTDPVQFSPAMDSLTDLKELRSIAGYKNVAYAFAPSAPPEMTGASGVAYADTAAATSIGFDRRVLLVFADDISGITNPDTNGDGTPDGVFYDSSNNVVTPAWLVRVLNQKAADALANNNYTKVVDGEVVPQSQYTYGVDYKLGDIVELAAPSGLLTPARITEYISTQDATGERAYPTVSVIT